MEKIWFLETELLACEGIVTLANRYADKAEECNDPIRKGELKNIAKVCKRMPEYPPKSFHEGLQSVLLYEFAVYME